MVVDSMWQAECLNSLTSVGLFFCSGLQEDRGVSLIMHGV